MARPPIPTYFFALVVVRRKGTFGDEFLLVHENKKKQGWYLPAGRVEAGESLLRAARRETLEETGVKILIDGILRIEHEPREADTRCRVFFSGVPKDDKQTTPKSTPDAESLGAAWVRIEELGKYDFRAPEVVDVLKYVAGGGTIHPVNVLTREGAPWGDDGANDDDAA